MEVYFLNLLKNVKGYNRKGNGEKNGKRIGKRTKGNKIGSENIDNV